MRTWIELGPSLDATAWRTRHEAGQVPDAAPYGLHHLQATGAEVAFRPPPATAVVSFGARTARAVTGMQWAEAALSPPPRRAELCLSWDERAGVPRAALSGGRVPVATGVIWLGEAATPGLAAIVRSLRRSALVWTLSAAQVPRLRSVGVPASVLEHLVFGVDADFFRGRAAEEADPDLVVSVGNDRHRDWGTLLEAFALLRSRRPGTRLEVVTAAPLPALTGLTVHPRLRHDELRDLYARASVVALPTLDNLHVSGMTAALEAQASARPVVLSGTPGAEDYVRDGTCGHLVPPGDAAALASRVQDVLDGGAATVADMGAAGRRAVDEVHSTRRQAVRLAGLIDRHC